MAVVELVANHVLGDLASLGGRDQVAQSLGQLQHAVQFLELDSLELALDALVGGVVLLHALLLALQVLLFLHHFS